MFDTLRVLSQGVNHAAEIMAAIQQLPDRSKDPQTKHVTYFPNLLNRMISEGLLISAGHKALSKDGRPIEHYQISSEGRHALHVVQWEQKIAAARPSEEPKPLPETGFIKPLPG